MMLGLWEWSALAGLEAAWRAPAYLSANALLLAALAWSLGPRTGADQAGGGWSAVSGGCWCLLVADELSISRAADAPWARALKLFAGSAGVVPAWAAIYWLHHGAPASGTARDRGPLWTLFVLLIIWAADTGAYFAGSRWGRRKLVPRISPGKSWEGLFGGLAMAPAARRRRDARARPAVAATAADADAHPAHRC
jgi:phosphatidate cytidylyltransferase